MVKEELVKVKCDHCGKDIDCPKHMMATSKKHLCYSCFLDPESVKGFSDEELEKVHVDAPMEELMDSMADTIAAMAVEKEFPGIWSEQKEKFREMSKKDLAREAFGIGVFIGAQVSMETLREMKPKQPAASSRTSNQAA